jgi:PIN domain nuclease of toxin-antitoxin system
MLLNTCALLWLVLGGGELSSDTLQKVAQAPFVYISAISSFEIGIKYRKGKLKLPTLPFDWLNVIVEHHDLQVLSLDLEVCIRSTMLPAVHSDPCDRMIIATAQIHKIPVVTADPIFNNYDIEILN